MKPCSTCGEVKPYTEFYSLSESTDGFGYRCKKCHAVYRKAYRQSTKGKAQTKKDKAKYRKKHPDKIRAYHREYAKVNPPTEESRLAGCLYAKTQRDANKAVWLQKESAKRQSRRAFINSFKDKPCTYCGEQLPPWCMDFDHVRGEKLKNVSHMLYSSFTRIKAEIDKCELVCANCHRVRTRNNSVISKLNPSTVPSRKARMLKVQKRVDVIKDAPCTDCQKMFPTVAMDFDHVREPKIATISQLVTRDTTWVKILTEIGKCELVCANCHRTRTKNRLGA
jgi:hypothetical protein